ncbi:MAG: hypothetical protein ACNA7Y_00610 [Gammaproteobacteria bacterium]
MNNPNLRACYYPTMAVFVDDSEHFLTRINMDLDMQLVCSYFSDPEDALSYLKKYGRPRALLQLKTLYQEIDNPNRSSEPSVMVLDYEMPGTSMNGFELSVKIQDICAEMNIPCPQILMLSGQAGTDLALEGFNKGYINSFISKKEPQYGRKVNEQIQILQRRFLKERSDSLLLALSAQPDFCWNDPQLIPFFTELCKQHRIVEYYMVSHSGDFLLLQSDGTVLWLVMISDTEREKGEKAVYLPFAQKIEGENVRYQYAFVKEPDLVPIQRDKILSFKQYLEHSWPPPLT